MNTYVYIRSEPGLWTVGFYAPSGKWEAESDHNDREEAAKRVAFLNGDAANIVEEPDYKVLYLEGRELLEDSKDTIDYLVLSANPSPSSKHILKKIKEYLTKHNTPNRDGE